MAEYILADIERKIGTKHNTWIYDITWVEPVTLDVFMTVVDESMRNFTRSHWDVMVTGDIPYGIYAGLRITARRDRVGLAVISADSIPQMITPMTQLEVERYIEIRQDQLAQENATQYEQLFNQ